MARVGWKRGVAWVALLSHLMVTSGLPLPAPPRKAKDDSLPFPCRDRPCGCLTYEECWQGDCCCFTLEEKLRWAEEKAVEPPAHVRPLVESRGGAPEKPKKPSCCESHPESDKAEATSPGCCPKDANDCRAEDAPDAPKVRWVAGFLAKKCRGEGAAELYELEASPAAVVSPCPTIQLTLTALLNTFDRHGPSRSRPPIPPPPRRP